MKSKSFSLKNLTSYFNNAEDSKQKKRFILPKISNFVPSHNLRRKESKIELNRKLSFFVDKSFGKTVQKDEEVDVDLCENLPKAPRNNFNSNFQDRILMKKEVPKVPVFHGTRTVFKSVSKQNMKTLKHDTSIKKDIKKNITRRKASFNTSMSILKEKHVKTDQKGSLDKSIILNNHINDYFDQIIKDFGLEEITPSPNEEINIFDLYLDSELNTLTD
jgi:hypothetical protein